METLVYILNEAAIFSAAGTLGIVGGVFLAAIKLRDQLREIDLKYAKRTKEEILVAENLAPRKHPFWLWSGLAPVGKRVSTVFEQLSTKPVLNVVVSPQYPEAFISFASERRVLPGTTLSVEVARDRLTGQVLEIRPAA